MGDGPKDSQANWGKFLVDDQCISCAACWKAVPAHFESHPVHTFALVHQQPRNAAEREECLRALKTCPVGAIKEVKVTQNEIQQSAPNQSEMGLKMAVIVVAEHFELPESVKAKIDSAMGRIQNLLPEGALIRLFFKRQARHGFEGTITVHAEHGDLTYTETGDNLIKIIHSMKSHLQRQLVSRKEKRVQRRKRKSTLPPPTSPAA